MITITVDDFFDSDREDSLKWLKETGLYGRFVYRMDILDPSRKVVRLHSYAVDEEGKRYFGPSGYEVATNEPVVETLPKPVPDSLLAAAFRRRMTS